ncbi:MAG: PIN domain-containing protein [Gammaproteobacteria bacterium]
MTAEWPQVFEYARRADARKRGATLSGVAMHAASRVFDLPVFIGVRCWLLRHFDIAAVGRPELLRARALGWNDFEDAVVAAAAESSRCDAIVTRNVKDFRASVVPVLTPEECLLGLPGSGAGQ